MRIKINKTEWEVVEQDNISVYITDEAGNEVDNFNYELLGYTDEENYLIWIPTNKIKKQKHILMHELTHAFIYSYKLRKKATSNVLRKFDEEEVCEFVAKYFDKIHKILSNYFKVKSQ